MSDYKPVEWLGDSKENLREFPKEVREEIGFAIFYAQQGDRHQSVKTLTGIVRGASLVEVVEDHDGDTYRAVYTVKFSGVIYVLHAFQKKSKQGKSTPQQDINLIKQRLKAAEAHYKEHYQLVQH